MPRIAVDKVEPDIEVKPSSSPKVVKKVTKTDPTTDSEIKEKSGTSVFASFHAYPEGVIFSGEGDNENIVLLLRAHIITNFPWVLLTMGALILPIIFVPLLGSVGLPFGGGTLVTFILFWYLGTFTYVFLNVLYWYFNVYIVTDERVVDVDWYSIIYHKVSSAQISKIQDISASNIGVLAGIFDYGNIEIQTAGEEPNFEFTAVPHPQLVAKEIQELMQQQELEWEPG